MVANAHELSPWSQMHTPPPDSLRLTLVAFPCLLWLSFAYACWRCFFLLNVFTMPHTLQLLSDNIADSWMLVPALLCFFTPAFITNFGCVYAGLVVPSLNSIKVRVVLPHDDCTFSQGPMELARQPFYYPGGCSTA